MNSFFGAAFAHTPTGFASPAGLPPQNIKTTTNARGATTTTYLLPSQYLPLTLPLRYFGLLPDPEIDRLDAMLTPMVQAGYSRYDNPATAPVSVDRAFGVPPMQDMLGPALQPFAAPQFRQGNNPSPAPAAVNPLAGMPQLPELPALPPMQLDPTTAANVDNLVNQVRGLLPPDV